PHMGWNGIRPAMIGGSSPILRDLPDIPDFYFVHSYFAECCPATVATCDYVQPFSACLQSGNFFGTQFHPEKSGDTGEILLRNFLQL
ncbi:MAG: imidazole glycerol phosphate synthase subunit HisH, partial [Bacteroidota bacterium]